MLTRAVAIAAACGLALDAQAFTSSGPSANPARITRAAWTTRWLASLRGRTGAEAHGILGWSS